jgi:hypothetical protein
MLALPLMVLLPRESRNDRYAHGRVADYQVFIPHPLDADEL